MPKHKRLAFAVVVGILACLVCYVKTLATPDHPADFGLAWFGARAILHGADPYKLVGPGLAYDWPWPLVYPATSFVVAIPLALLPQLSATLVFVFASWSLLAYSVTRDGWNKTPMFLSAASLVTAGAGQWSALFTAAMGLPFLAFLFVAKPTDGLALSLAGSSAVRKWALAGGVVITALSLVLFPSWIVEWLHQLPKATQMAPPLLRPGGPFIAIALLRWKRPEARLILALALIPQVGAWYTVIPLFLIPETVNESMFLSLSTSLGWLLQDHIMTATNEVQFNNQVGALIVAFSFLPSILLLLKRPSESTRPSI